MWLNPFFFLFRRRPRNQHRRKSRDRIGGKVLLLDLILNFVCLFVCLFFGCSFNRFLFLSSFFFFYFVIICPVPECSGMFHVPGFVDARYLLLCVTVLRPLPPIFSLFVYSVIRKLHKVFSC